MFPKLGWLAPQPFDFCLLYGRLYGPDHVLGDPVLQIKHIFEPGDIDDDSRTG
jgi:hypothetical protein